MEEAEEVAPAAPAAATAAAAAAVPAAAPAPSSLRLQRGDRCSFCGEAWQRWGSHAVTSLPCGHTFGEVCLRAHIRIELASGRRHASCPVCKARIKRGAADLRRLYLSSEVAAATSPDQIRRTRELAREIEVERRALAAATARAESAEEATRDAHADRGRARIADAVPVGAGRAYGIA